MADRDVGLAGGRLARGELKDDRLCALLLTGKLSPLTVPVVKSFLAEHRGGREGVLLKLGAGSGRTPAVQC